MTALCTAVAIRNVTQNTETVVDAGIILVSRGAFVPLVDQEKKSHHDSCIIIIQVGHKSQELSELF